MAIQILPYDVSFRDAKGFLGRTRTFISTDDTVATFRADVAAIALAIQAALVNLTNARYQSSSGLDDIGKQPLGYGTNAEYPAEWMKAVYTFSTATGDVSRFKIPAPLLSQFDVDGVTVKNDGSVAIVVAYVNAVKGNTNGTFPCNPAGQAFTHFEGGLLRFGKQPRRFNIRIKSAGLVAGEGE